MSQGSSTVCWFEIPAKDIKRAGKFYGEVLTKDLHVVEWSGFKMAIFPHEGEQVGGAIVEGQGYTPGEVGPLVYLNCSPDLAPALARVEKAGGKILLPKTSIGDHGFMAHVRDTEGNRVALHSTK